MNLLNAAINVGLNKRSAGQKKRRTREYALNSLTGGSVLGAIEGIRAKGNPRNIRNAALLGTLGGAYLTYRNNKKKK